MKRWIVYLLAGIAALLVGDAIYVGLTMRDAMSQAVHALEGAAESLGEMRVDDARRDLERARAGARKAGGLTSRPAYRIIEILPWAGPNARAAAAMSEAAAVSSDAGLVLLDGMEAVGGRDRDALVAALYERGRVHFDAVDAVVPFAARAEHLLAGALEVLEESPEPTIRSLRTGMAVARGEVEAAASATEKLHAVLDVLPRMTARSGRRRYLLTFQTNSEGRGGGGVIGAYGILGADDGRLRLIRIAPVGELLDVPVRVTSAARWFQRQYGFASALTDVRQANLSPHFPASAGVLMDMYRQITGFRVDGVIAMDALALADLTRATGPVTGHGWEIEVGPDNARDVLLHDAYLHFDRESDQENYVQSVIAAFWQKATTEDLDGAALVEGLADAVAGRNLQVYASNEKDALTTLEADGSIARGGPNTFMVFHNHLAANKTDFFLTRTVRAIIRIRPDGAAEVVTKIVLDNRAPDGPPSDLLGSGARGYAVGSNSMYLTVVLPQGARVTDAPGGASRGTELRFPTVSSVVALAPGERRTVSVAFEIPGLVDLGDDDRSFVYHLVPHATPTADRYTLTVVPPSGYKARIEGGRHSGAVVTLSGVLEAPAMVKARLDR